MSDKPIKFGKVGRPRGGPTKNLLSVRAALHERGYNPIKEYIRLMELIDDPVEKLKALQFLMQYTYPKLKEVEAPDYDVIQDTTIDVTPPQEMTDEELLAEVENEAKETNS